jgi:hypothetical protein
VDVFETAAASLLGQRYVVKLCVTRGHAKKRAARDIQILIETKLSLLKHFVPFDHPAAPRIVIK